MFSGGSVSDFCSSWGSGSSIWGLGNTVERLRMNIRNW